MYTDNPNINYLIRLKIGPMLMAVTDQHSMHSGINYDVGETGSDAGTVKRNHQCEGSSGHNDKSVNLSSRHWRSRRPSRSFFASSRLRRVTARFDSRYLQQIHNFTDHLTVTTTFQLYLLTALPDSSQQHESMSCTLFFIQMMQNMV